MAGLSIDDVKDLVSKQRNDVKRAFLGIHSPYVVRLEYVEYVQSQSDVFDGNPGKCGLQTSRVLIQLSTKKCISIGMLPLDL